MSNDERFEELETRLMGLFYELEEKLHKLEDRLKKLEDKLENLEIEMEDMKDDIIRLKYGR
jgi:predicted  nucleic acid-binding Zn-ribbon protein